MRYVRMLSLKQLAAEAVPQNVRLKELHDDVTKLIEYYRTTHVACEHGTMWPYKCNQVDGKVAYACGCKEEWGNGMWIRDLATCERECECMGVCGWDGVMCRAV